METLQQLKTVTQALCGELASWRRRALRAEAELQEARAPSPGTDLESSERQLGPGSEDSSVKERLADQELRLRRAREEVLILKSRLRFVDDRASRPA